MTDRSAATAQGSPAERRPTVFFDGQCPVCRREIALYQRLDRAAAIEWRDLHEPDALEGTALTWEEAMQRFHCKDRDGTLYGGVAAFTVVWSYLPYWRWLAWFVRGFGLTRPLEPLYRWYARRRYQRVCRIDSKDCS
ncbi:hypothetical protein CKO15_02415 [Halorhodospira abdelmalekii]|uniref:thiol-disulfide oxidoreductase DCC family protein n=1 Tax=Halorhodospira abdelmalekii TaxID=421629 RepID=UPI0019055551|nr:DUF393 domain-containing protein [Halorhodospira abdelmalekii]MBK1734153.1 hypothetical protein [Halorhodospira abdelmalekii]